MPTAPPHPEHAAFLAGIIAAPADDLPRLVYADWLDERAGTVKCQHCRHDPVCCSRCDPPPENPGCHRCDGGRVSNGNAERAEFIRVQIELAKFGPLPPASVTHPLHTPAILTLRRRERELWSAGAHGDKPDGLIATLTTDYFGHLDSHRLGIYRRGFVHTVRCRLSDWIGRRCDNGCTEGGRTQDELGRSAVICVRCQGRAYLPAIGPAVVAAHPIQHVTFTDLRPDAIERDGLSTHPEPAVTFSWSHPDPAIALAVGGFPHVVPSRLFDRLKGVKPRPISKVHYRMGIAVYRTSEDADAAISAAALAWAKSATPQTPVNPAAPRESA